MHQILEDIRNTRIYIAALLDALTPEQLNTVPAGFNNNIIWNAGHLVAAQRSICYFKSGIAPLTDDDPFRFYRPGTRPGQPLGIAEIELIKSGLASSVQELDNDLRNGGFDLFKAWTNRYKSELRTAEDAFRYVHFHDGLHLGVITSIQKLV